MKNYPKFIDTNVSFSEEINLSSQLGLMYQQKVIDSALTFTVGNVVLFGNAFVSLVADGTNTPDFSAFTAHPNSDTWNNTVNAINEVYFWYNGDVYYYLITDTGRTYSAPDTTSPTIQSFSLEISNVYVDVTFSEGVYGANDGASPVLAADLQIASFAQNGGGASAVSISSITNNADGALSGGETIIRVVLSVTGTPTGVETFEIQPIDGASIYDAAGNAMVDIQTTGTVTLNDESLADFVFTIDTTKTGSASDTIILPTVSGLAYDFEVTWDSEGTETYTSSVLSSITHTFSVGGVKTITISGTFPSIRFNNTGDKNKIIGITSFGNVGWTSLALAFYGCSNLASVSGVSSFSSVTNMAYMFAECTSLTSLDLSSWNVSSVTNMGSMFFGCSGLTTLNVSNWITTSLIDMESMLNGCSSLTSLDLSSWDVSGVTTMLSAFKDCSGLTSLDLSSWNTASLTTMEELFHNCSSITSVNLAGWDLLEVTTIRRLFFGCTSLTSPIFTSWSTSNISNMSGVFYNCSSLTSLDLSSWDVSGVTNMGSMFFGCSGLTSLDLSSWNVSSVTNMAYMFASCILLKIDISNFNIESVTSIDELFDSCDINDVGTANVDNIYISWASQTLDSTLNIDMGSSQYSSTSSSARSIIVSMVNSLIDGGLV